jgi:hypothetical protein
MTLYKIELDSDLGELWLNNKKKPIAYIHANDSRFDESYYKFLIKQLGGEVKVLYATELLDEEEYELLFECDSQESFYEVLKEKL